MKETVEFYSMMARLMVPGSILKNKNEPIVPMRVMVFDEKIVHSFFLNKNRIRRGI